MRGSNIMQEGLFMASKLEGIVLAVQHKAHNRKLFSIRANIEHPFLMAIKVASGIRGTHRHILQFESVVACAGNHARSTRALLTLTAVACLAQQLLA